MLAAYKAEKRKAAESEGIEPGRVLTPAEREYALEEYDSMMSTFVNYAELAVQFGYATLFAAAFPLSPMMACLNAYIKIRCVSPLLSTNQLGRLRTLTCAGNVICLRCLGLRVGSLPLQCGYLADVQHPTAT